MTPIQLDIIRAFGSKELSEGCLTLDKEWTMYKCLIRREWRMIHSNEWGWWSWSSYSDYMWEVLGKVPELFPDVARVARETNKSLRVEMNEMTEKSYIQIWTGDVHRIPYHPTYKLIDQDEQLTLIPLLNLLWTPLITLA